MLEIPIRLTSPCCTPGFMDIFKQSCEGHTATQGLYWAILGYPAEGVRPWAMNVCVRHYEGNRAMLRTGIGFIVEGVVSSYVQLSFGGARATQIRQLHGSSEPTAQASIVTNVMVRYS